MESDKERIDDLSSDAVDPREAEDVKGGARANTIGGAARSDLSNTIGGASGSDSTSE